MRCSKLLDGAIRCHGVLLAVSGVISFDNEHPSVWQRCFALFCIAGKQQAHNKPSLLEKFLLHVFLHDLSACYMQHAQAKEDKCNIGTGTGEVHLSPSDFSWSIFSATVVDTGDSFFVIDGLRLWITYCALYYHLFFRRKWRNSSTALSWK